MKKYRGKIQNNSIGQLVNEKDFIQNGKDFILTIVERMSRFLLMKKIPDDKNADIVASTVIKLPKPFKRHLKSITTDNGGGSPSTSLFPRG